MINFLSERGLQIQPDKTKITHINNGFDFFGQNVKKYKDKLLIKPSMKSIKSIKLKVFDMINSAKGLPADKLIYFLNPILRG